MLTADQLDALTDPILKLYQEYEQTVINDIARRLSGLNMASPTSAWQMQRLSESGMVFEDALKELEKLTGKSQVVLKSMFEKAGVKALKFDDSVYKAAGLNPLPLNLSPAMIQVLKAGLQKTNWVMQNMTMTTANQAQQSFIDAADLAYMQVSSGAFDYNTAIRNAVQKASKAGLNKIDYASGRQDDLDVAMRRTVLTGVSQTAGNLQIARMDEMGCDLVAVSAHVGARNKGVGPMNHESWQGKVYCRKGHNPKYKDFVETTGYGSVEGLMGINCRHSFYPFFEDISENAYSQSELNEYEKKTVVYNGREISVYEATQKQRYIERNIQYWKRQAGALKSAGLDNTDELTKLGDWQASMRDFLKQTKLPRQSAREQI